MEHRESKGLCPLKKPILTCGPWPSLSAPRCGRQNVMQLDKMLHGDAMSAQQLAILMPLLLFVVQYVTRKSLFTIIFVT